jgi:deazaflavin-dependent oxidoreductase (nitroreductase family)
MSLDPTLGNEDYCYLTTTGRITGKPHEIEIWFALVGNTAYLMNGDSKHPAGHGDWVRNLRKQPACTLRIAGTTYDATARFVIDPAEDAGVRRLLVEKYATPERPLKEWERIALPVAIEIQA